MLQRNTFLAGIVLVGLIFLIVGCSFGGPASAHSSQPTQYPRQACVQTIEKLYNVQFYCPDHLAAFESLFTKKFIQAYHPSLARCDEIDFYQINKLIDPEDPLFPKPIGIPAPGVYQFYAEITINNKPGIGLQGTGNPSPTWIQTRVESGSCKIDDINGGG